MSKSFNESYFKSHDHHRLYYQEWACPKPKAVLVFVHGLNEHSGRYEHVASYFKGRNYTSYFFDHRGHGRSDGLRSFVGHFDDYLKDLDEFVSLVATLAKKTKIFIIGHSMGGQIVLNYAGRPNTPANGFVVSSPNIEMAFKIPKLKAWVGRLASQIMPRLLITNEIDAKWISRDPDVVAAYQKDPLVSPKITLKLGAELIANQKNIFSLAAKVKLPILMLHGGDDRICSPEATKRFFDKLRVKDKEMKIYEGCYHELFNEYARGEVLKDIAEWLEAHA